MKTFRLGLSLLALLLASALSAGSALAQSDIDRCENKTRQVPDDQRIAACSALINSGQYRGKDLSWIYSNRGVSYERMRQVDNAIADYSEAIRLDPDYPSAYYNRGCLYLDRAQFDPAIADFTKAMSLAAPSGIHSKGQALSTNQVRADYYEARGSAWRGKGDMTRAVADFKEAVRLDPGHQLANKALRELGISR